MRTKSWPLWETWQLIFGKDRASGGGSEEVDKAAAELRPQRAPVSETNENNFPPSADDVPESEAHGDSAHTDLLDDGSGNEDRVASTTKGPRKKRKVLTSDEAMMEFMSKLHSDTNSRLDLVASKIGYEFDLGKARQEVFDKLGTVEGLSLEERYDLCNILGDKSQPYLEVFIGMFAHARLGYLKRLLSQHHDIN